MLPTAGRSASRAVAALGIIAAFSSCRGDRSGGPVGRPADIVTRAPDRTLAAATAQVIVSAPTAEATGSIDLAAHTGRLSITAPGSARAELLIAGQHGYLKGATDATYTRLDTAVPEVLAGGDPWADIDLVRGTTHILSDGGGEVRGLSTIGYTLTVDPQQAIAATSESRRDELRTVLQGRSSPFQMAVWIDRDLLIRRLEVTTSFKFAKTTPPTRIDGKTIATDVDFVVFGRRVPPPPAVVTAPTGG